MNTGLLNKNYKRGNKMVNVQRLISDDDYFSAWFIERHFDDLVKLAQLQGFNHSNAVFFELHNIY
jgi:hypothetical protein